MPAESLTFPLHRAAASFAEKAAVIVPEAGGRAVSYRWLEDHSSILAASLERLGVAPGDRVGLWLKNGLEYILAFYGILKAGGVVVPISTHYRSREVWHQLKTTEAKGLIAQAGLLDTLDRLKNGLPAGRKDLGFLVTEGLEKPLPGAVSFPSLLQGPKGLDRSLDLDPQEAPAVLPFSSGTTGLPKGVMLTHHNLLSKGFQVAPAEIEHILGVKFPRATRLNEKTFHI